MGNIISVQVHNSTVVNPLCPEDHFSSSNIILSTKLSTFMICRYTNQIGENGTLSKLLNVLVWPRECIVVPKGVWFMEVSL